MIAFPAMLLEPARQAGMKTPPDADCFNGENFPHFAVFCNVQLGGPMPSPDAHWSNANVIAAIPDDKIKTVTFNQLIAAGLVVGYPVL